MVDKSIKREQLRRKINITEAAMEGTRRRIGSYQDNDEVCEGLFWAFEELKDAIDGYMESEN